MAGEAGITKQATQVAVGAVFDAIAEALGRVEEVSIVGFGRSSRTERPAREGRNPRTGESIAIGSSAGVSFKAGNMGWAGTDGASDRRGHQPGLNCGRNRSSGRLVLDGMQLTAAPQAVRRK